MFTSRFDRAAAQVREDTRAFAQRTVRSLAEQLIRFSVLLNFKYTAKGVSYSRIMSKLTTRKAANARAAIVLEAIPNIGASLARDLRSIGVKHPYQLIGRDPHALYQALCDQTRARQDPCVLDTFISAVRFMEGAPARPWWRYTAERKKKFDSSSLGPSRKKRQATRASAARAISRKNVIAS